jgi:hypothetical protein
MQRFANESTLDRVVRIIAGVVIAVAIVAGGLASPWLYAAALVAGIFLVTGLVGFCPIYALLRVRTAPRRR